MKKYLFSLLVVVTIYGCISIKGARAAFLDFDPKSVSTKVGTTFDVKLKIDAGTDEILSTDARVIYDPKILSVEDIKDGSYFSIPKKDCTTTPGKCYIAGIIETPGDSQTGSGVLVTLTFKGIANGSDTLSIICTPGETAKDSNIAKNELNVSDIIECTKNGKVAVTVGNGVATPSATITPSGGGAGNPPAGGPSTLPRSGVVDDVLKVAVPGAILFIFGIAVKLLL